MSIVIKTSYALTSSSYEIKNNTIYAIPTTFDYKYDELLGNIKYNYQLQVYNNNNELVNEDDSIGTGYKLSINNNYYDIVLLGDITGDGKIQLGDVSALYNHFKNNKTIDGLKLEAGLLTGNSKVMIGDVAKLYN